MLGTEFRPLTCVPQLSSLASHLSLVCVTLHTHPTVEPHLAGSTQQSGHSLLLLWVSQTTARKQEDGHEKFMHEEAERKSGKGRMMAPDVLWTDV